MCRWRWNSGCTIHVLYIVNDMQIVWMRSNLHSAQYSLVMLSWADECQTGGDKGGTQYNIYNCYVTCTDEVASYTAHLSGHSKLDLNFHVHTSLLFITMNIITCKVKTVTQETIGIIESVVETWTLGVIMNTKVNNGQLVRQRTGN